jgi:hypothetical protein
MNTNDLGGRAFALGMLVLVGSWMMPVAGAATQPLGYEGEVTYTISAPTASVQGSVAVRFDKAVEGAPSGGRWSLLNSGGHFRTQAGRLCKTGDVVSTDVQGELQGALSSIVGDDAARQYLIRVGFPHIPIRITCTTSPGVSGAAPGDELQSACGDPIPRTAGLPAVAPRFDRRDQLDGYKVCTYPFGSTGGTRVNFIAWHLREITAAAPATVSAPGPGPATTQGAELAGIRVSAGALKPEFAPAKPVYYLAVDHDVESVTIASTPSDPAAHVSFYRPATMTTATSATVKLPVGQSAIPVTVTAADGHGTGAYVIQITRAP